MATFGEDNAPARADDNVARDDEAAAPLPPRPFPSDSATRKTFPITTGCLDYFPDALAEVSQISWAGNEKHNPGQPLHWSRGKSNDHADCAGRHLMERGGFDTIVVAGKTIRVRHSAALAWRALALCQEEIEAEKGLPLSRGSK